MLPHHPPLLPPTPFPPCLPRSMQLRLHACLSAAVSVSVAALPAEAVPKKGPGPTQIYEQQKPSLWSCRKGISHFGAIKAHVASVPASPCRANIMSNPEYYRINPNED